MKLISTKMAAELLSMDRESVGKKLAHFIPVEGPRGAKLFKSDVALRTLLGLGSEEDCEEKDISAAEASRQLTIARKQQIDLEMEVTRKERINLESIEQNNERVLSNVAGLLKAHKDKFLDETLINDLFTELRGINSLPR